MNSVFEENIINVRDFGAIADGKTDDTAAIQAALDKAGENKNTVFFPAGVYMCHDLVVHPNTGLLGLCNWSLYTMGSSVLMLNSDKATCVLNVTDAVGCTINGININGNEKMGDNIHGIYKKGPNKNNTTDSYKIERCRIDEFSGNGIHIDRCWCYSIRSTMITHNKGAGIFANSCDGYILDCWITGNNKGGYYTNSWSTSTTITANRIEWNGIAGIYIGCGNSFCITGNYIDRSFGPGISINCNDSPDVDNINITGNFIYRNGAWEDNFGADTDSHIFIHRAKGVIITNNLFGAYNDGGGKSGKCSPSFGIVYDNLENSIIKNNTWNKGVTREFFVDKGKNSNLIIKDNVGCIHE